MSAAALCIGNAVLLLKRAFAGSIAFGFTRFAVYCGGADVNVCSVDDYVKVYRFLDHDRLSVEVQAQYLVPGHRLPREMVLCADIAVVGEAATATLKVAWETPHIHETYRYERVDASQFLRLLASVLADVTRRQLDFMVA